MSGAMNDGGQPNNGTQAGEPRQAPGPILYEQVQALNPRAHGHLGICEAPGRYSFAIEAHAVPITVQEFPLVLKNFPILFTSGDRPMPLAALGLKAGENLFVDDDGDWARDVYIPAYIRRYPFIFATDQDEKSYTLGVDINSPMVGIDYREPFFVEGEPSQYLKEIIEFCQNFQKNYMQTRAFSEIVSGHGLFAQREVQMTDEAGNKTTLARHVGIDQERLDALSNEAFLDLRTKGALPWIYFQLASGVNWERLVARERERERERERGVEQDAS